MWKLHLQLCRYLGEDTGDVAVLEYNKEESKLRQMPYNISSQAAVGNQHWFFYGDETSLVSLYSIGEFFRCLQ